MASFHERQFPVNWWFLNIHTDIQFVIWFALPNRKKTPVNRRFYTYTLNLIDTIGKNFQWTDDLLLAVIWSNDERNGKKYTQWNKGNLRDLIAATGQVISNWIQTVNFSARVTLEFDRWPRKTIGHFFYTMSSFVHHFKSISEFKLELQSGNAQFGSKLAICPVWLWNLMNDHEKR